MNKNVTCDQEQFERLCEAFRNKLFADLRKYKSFTEEQIQEYIAEAEDQDGLAYWAQFEDYRALSSDMRTYFESK